MYYLTVCKHFVSIFNCRSNWPCFSLILDIFDFSFLQYLRSQSNFYCVLNPVTENWVKYPSPHPGDNQHTPDLIIIQCDQCTALRWGKERITHINQHLGNWIRLSYNYFRISGHETESDMFFVILLGIDGYKS